MRFLHPPTRSLALAGAVVLLLAGSARGASQIPTLPPEIPASERARLQQVADQASVAARADGEPFVARRDVFEYLLDHPEFATHVTRALRLARYRIWHGPDGLWLDDGWGAIGRFSVVYVTDRMRVMYASGRYKQWYTPTIHGEAVVVIEYGVHPAADNRSLITSTVTGFVKLDSGLLTLAGRLVSAVATAKAETEARRLVRVFARTTRAVEEDPARVHDLVRQRSDVPQRELEEFGRLLQLR